MLQVQTRDPPHPTGPYTCVVGSFNDHRSYAMEGASSETSALPPYLRYGDFPPVPDPPSATSTPASSSSSSSHSSPASIPKLTALGSVQSATSSPGDWEGTAARVNSAMNPLTEELQHPGDMSGENSVTESHCTASDSEGSLARVDLRDIGEDSHNFTTNTLRRCKLQVLKPYWFLLMFIGWRVFRHDVMTPDNWKLRTLNIVYPMLIILLLLYTYTYEMIACEWKLNVVQDTVIHTSPKPIVPTTTTVFPNHTTSTNVSHFTLPLASLGPAAVRDTTTSSPDTSPYSGVSPYPQPCDHIVTTYLIPNLLHFLAYFLGLYYFRIQDNEQIYALMEKVFLQANPLHTSSSSQQKLVHKTRVFLVGGAVWVALTLGLQGLYVSAFDFPRLAVFEESGQDLRWLTFAIELLGRLVFNSVLLAIIINYVTQCEMVMFYVKGLSLRLQEKSADIKTAFKDTWLLRQNLSLLNGVISKMTSLALVILAELTVIGIGILVVNSYDMAIVWVYRSLFPVVWGSMLFFPLFQAARVNSVCLRIKKTSLEMRVFGYKNSSQLELDSFLQFVHATRLRAKLFHVPIQPSYLMAACILGAFIFLLLVQTTSIVPNNDIV